tara:strand:- start:569 stop:1183 length:615 start_codon:yes stop_codon:yes gene_type:complete
MDLNELNKIIQTVDKYDAKLLPVIKDQNSKDILKVYDRGFRDFGENRLSEILEHKKFLIDCNLHFIAPLQSRKIKEIMKNCKSIHTISRTKEIELINQNFNDHETYVQINIDDDPKKSGIKTNEVDGFFNKFESFNFFPNGIMCIPSIENDPTESFFKMSKINERLIRNFKEYNGFLSMGMSNDYKIALDYGATIIRVGSKIFK